VLPPPCLCTGKPVHRRGGGSLAYLICDDGTFVKKDRGVVFYTNSFSLDQVELLAAVGGVLTDKFNLKCTIPKHRDNYVTAAGPRSLHLTMERPGSGSCSNSLGPNKA